ncbi:MAG TPA: tetratricopeptide repeat protein [Bacteroidia bacterium]|jgi:TolA-binding protein|nr:tetratricopeptide repeat protein [Bacteroidia bacterium]
MMIRKYGVCVAFCLFCLLGKAQKTTAYIDRDLLYKQGLDLFDKKQFVAAQKSFGDYISLTSNTRLLKIDAEYYAAASAIELFHKDGEWRMREFITAHPESNKINGAWFYLGKSSFRKKKYEETIQNFDKVDIYKLPKEDLAELYFKRGYSYIETKNPEKAKADLYEIKDADNKYIYPALYYYSHLSYDEKKYETALDGFNKLIGNETFGSVVPYYITQIYFVQGKYDKVVKNGPDLLNDSNQVQKAGEINRMIGESYYNLQDYKNALAYLKKTEMASALNAEGNYAIGYCYYKLNDCANAITHFEKVVETNQDTLAQNTFYHMADCHMKNNERTKAKNDFYESYKLDFNKKITEDALYSYAKLTYELDMSPFNEAVKAFTKYLKEYPNSPRKDEAYHYLINVYATTKNYARAIISIESLDGQDPIMKATYEKLVFFKAVEFFNNNDLDNAEKQFKKALGINSDKTYNALSNYWMGEISYQRKDYGTAIETWKNFLLQPNNVNLAEFEKTHYNLGYAYFQRKEKGDYESANIEFRKYIMNKSADNLNKTADANVRAADCYFMNRDFNQAADYYETAIALNKTDVDYCYYQKALCSGLLKNNKEKINDLKYIETKFPKSNYLSAAIFEIAETYLKDMNNGEDAKIYYEKILNNYPKSSFVNTSLAGIGLIYYNKKEDDKAFEYFNQIVQKDPKGDDAREVLPMIKKTFEAKGKIDEMEKYFASIGNPLTVNQIETALYESAKEAYYNKTNCDDAMPKFESYIAKFPEGKYITEAQFCFAECTYSKGLFEKSLPAYKYVISKSRSIYTETSLNKASYLLFKDKKYEEALPLYIQMQEIAETPANKLIAKIGAMRCAFYLNQFEAALTESNKVLGAEKLNPQQTSEAKYIKAKSLFETQRYDDALTEFRNIAKFSKNVTGAEAYYYIARIHFNKQDYKECEKVINTLFSFAYTNDDWNAKGMLLIADSYAARNQIEDAKIILQTILDGKPKQEYIDEVNARLAQIKLMEANKALNEQPKQTEMKVEFNTNSSDQKLFTVPDTAKKQPVNTIPN